jgi:very-short-patch-repair endonuclease
MELLNKIIAYWYDCIRNEDILEKDISINVRRKAVLYPFDNDPFVFDRRENLVLVSGDEKLTTFSVRITTQGYEPYYGYPILFYFEEDPETHKKKYLVAPLFIIRVKFVKENQNLYLQKDEQNPTCGIQAFSRLGFRTEQIAVISESLERLFRSELSNVKDLAEKCLEVIQKETELPINEPIDPSKLTNMEKISKNMASGLYNKSLVFAGENTAYNISLLQDLLELKGKNDLGETALSFILEKVSSVKGVEKIPVLPFPSNEYQVKALQGIFQNKLSVITGPPGTGKSQYISNLLINLFLEGKSVLFVSHTNKAVDVVNEKINEQFRNLMLRTGSKPFRQELKGMFNELILESERKPSKQGQIGQIQSMWQTILKYREKLLEQDQLEQQFENNYLAYSDRKALFCVGYNLEQSFEELSPNLDELEVIRGRLEYLKAKIESKRFSLWERVILSFFPHYIENKKGELFVNLSRVMPPNTLRILQNSPRPAPIRNWDAQGWLRLSEYLELSKCFFEVETIRQKLEAFQPRAIIEQKIRKLEKDFYDASKRFVGDIYIQEMLGKGKSVGKVKSFLHQVDSSGPNDDGIDSDLFKGALDVLKIWSSTLKPIRRTFPLSPGIFDYVIFDEASQVDLPSAAPALYRAKRAIVVGDPMQLTHIAGITRDIDKGLAKVHGLTEKKDIYPSKIRYCDISLYKSAEHSLNHKPILLTNHYRSEDQIIALCNQLFYGKGLRIMTTLDYSRYPGSLPMGVHWINCEGEVFKHPAGSRINHDEVLLVNKIFQDVLRKISGTTLSIGVVTPYSKQEDTITKQIIESTPNYPEFKDEHKVEVLTAHKFQGSEKDIMIFSLVLASRGNGNSDQWYNIYPQILNVALSRAKYLLYIVGDKSFCQEHSCYKGEDCILKRLVKTYDEIKKQEKAEEYTLFEKFDSPTERYLFERLQEIDFERLGYKLIPKLVVKRYTLDFALLGKKKIDVECDGYQHEIIEGLPVLEDVERDEFLKKEGWEVIRFPNHRILSQTNMVVEHILNLLKDC